MLLHDRGMYDVINPFHECGPPVAEVGKYPSSCPRLTPIVHKIDNNSVALTLMVTNVQKVYSLPFFLFLPARHHKNSGKGSDKMFRMEVKGRNIVPLYLSDAVQEGSIKELRSYLS